MNGDDLTPIRPKQARKMYLADRVDLRERSRQAHDYRIRQFEKWLDQEDIDDMNDLSGRDLARYRTYRRDECNIAPATLRGNSFTLKAFLEFCESIEGVSQGLGSKVRIPSMNEDQLVREHDLDPERVHKILNHLDRYEYASREHVILALLFHIGCRLGGIRAIDLRDYHPDEGYIELHHRPPHTPLKNGVPGERYVAISDEVVDLLEDYRQVNRVDVTDDQGREPLITTTHGRISGTSIRETVYRLTSPCRFWTCPHDREPATCEATETGMRSKCPSTRNPHDVRSAAIVEMKRNGIPLSGGDDDRDEGEPGATVDDGPGDDPGVSGAPPEVIEKRVNATEEVIDNHYDERPRDEKLRSSMERRRKHLGGSI